MPVKVIPVRERYIKEVKNGRPKKLLLPDLPEEIYKCLTPLEKEYFNFFVEALKKELPNITPREHICVMLGAMEFINTLRLEFEQLKTGQLVTQSRQNPSIQLREWMKDALSRHKDKLKEKEGDADRERLKQALLSLSAANE